MSSASEMWLSAENTSVPAGSPVSTGAPGRRSFGAPTPSTGYVMVPGIYCLPCRLPGKLLRIRSNGQRTLANLLRRRTNCRPDRREDEGMVSSTFDFVVVGSGGGGLTAAVAAADAGASVLVVEKQSLLGGSTCMSGGMAWVPDNPVMRAAGVHDSYGDAMAHFETVVGDVGP